MAIMDQKKTESYWAIHGDCIEAMHDMPSEKFGLSLYSPPFAGLYHYSSNPRDLSNARSTEEFFTHYELVIKELFRLTMPGRMSAVHCCDIPLSNTGCDHLFDLPGEIIRLHEKNGFRFAGRYHVWKEPLGVRNRTMAKNLAHKTIVDDSSKCSNAGADQLLLFRRTGDNTIPITHPTGLSDYAGEREIPEELRKYKGWTGKQTENRYSHWIWRQYASSFWDDIRIDRVLPFRDSRDPNDERHVHPLQLDVIERAITLWSNPSEVVFTPFMGVGSEVYGAVTLGRKGIGVELKPSYFKQALLNLEHAEQITKSQATDRQQSLFGAV